MRIYAPIFIGKIGVFLCVKEGSCAGNFPLIKKERRIMNTIANQRKSNSKTKKALFTTKELVIISLLSALAYVLMLMHLPFR